MAAATAAALAAAFAAVLAAALAAALAAKSALGRQNGLRGLKRRKIGPVRQFYEGMPKPGNRAQPRLDWPG